MIERAKATFHSTAEEAAKIALAAESKQLILGHFSARYGDLEPFLLEAGAVFNNCVLAKDGEIITI
jgi:ribonuclease Z